MTASTWRITAGGPIWPPIPCPECGRDIEVEPDAKHLADHLDMRQRGRARQECGGSRYHVVLAVRENARMTQAQLAEYLGVAANTVARIERAESRLTHRTAVALARLSGVHLRVASG